MLCCADTADNIAKYLSIFPKLLRTVKRTIFQNSSEQRVWTSTPWWSRQDAGALEDGVSFSNWQASPPVLSEQGSPDACASEPENQGGVSDSSLLSLCCEKSILLQYLGLLNITEGFNPWKWETFPISTSFPASLGKTNFPWGNDVNVLKYS